MAFEENENVVWTDGSRAGTGEVAGAFAFAQTGSHLT